MCIYQLLTLVFSTALEEHVNSFPLYLSIFILLCLGSSWSKAFVGNVTGYYSCYDCQSRGQPCFLGLVTFWWIQGEKLTHKDFQAEVPKWATRGQLKSLKAGA